MSRKYKLIWEIRDLLEKIRKKHGLYIDEYEDKHVFVVKVYYTNIEKQKGIIEGLLRKYNIDKKYYRFFSNLLDGIVKIEVFKDGVDKKVKDLKKLRDELKELYDKFNEGDYIKELENEINKEFKYDLDELDRYLNKENLYLKFLNGEIELNDAIEDYEYDLIFDGYEKRRSGVLRKIRMRVKKLLNGKKFIIVWIKKGFVLVACYENKYYNRGWHYENNEFYLIDLRNNRVYNMTEKIREVAGVRFIDDLDEVDDIYDLWEKVELDELLF